MITFATTTRPFPTDLDYTQVRTVSLAVIPLRTGEDARVTVTTYSGKEPARRSQVTVLVPGAWPCGPTQGGCRTRFARVDVAERVAQRAADYVAARWG